MNMHTLIQRYGVQIPTLIVVVIVVSVAVPLFRGEAAIFSTLEGMVLLGIVAAGIATTMIAGELDLSVGSMAIFSGVIAIQFSSLGLVPAMALGTTVCAIVGALQGYMIVKLHMSSLVLTVATSILLQGAAWLLASGRPIALKDLTATDMLLERFLVFTPASVTAILVIAGLGVFLSRTRWGRELYATGGARAEAAAAGVSVRKSMMTAFGISAGCAGLAGALTCMQGGSADPGGFNYVLLTAVAACLIGGVSLYGGRGDAINVALGVLILTVVTSSMAAAGAPTYLANLITGSLLIVVVTIDFIVRRLTAARLSNKRAHVIEEAAVPG